MSIKRLYLNNYKGFVKTFIPIKDVNFLVGENSTGKTAVLDVLGTVLSMQFQNNADLNGEEQNLGYFNEIMNQKLKGRNKTFEIGIERNEPIGEVGGTIAYELYSYSNDEGLPRLKNYRCLYNAMHVKINFSDTSSETIKYYTKKTEIQDFTEWIQNDELSKVKVKLLKLPNSLPFFWIRGFVLYQFESDEINGAADALNLTMIKDSAIFRRFAPIRAKARRYYEGIVNKYSSEGQHTPEIMNRIYRDCNQDIIDAINSFGRESSLYDEIQVKTLGKGQTVPFKMSVKYGDIVANIINVGYGVSQVLPLVVDILLGKDKVFSIQQPEVHLHPKAQAAFGQFIYESFSSRKNKFFIETHSDYTIDRFRLQLKKDDGNGKPSSQVLFFERTPQGTKATPITIHTDGKYDKQPEAFRQFFIEEELELLQI